MKQLSRSVLPGYGVAGASTALATLAQFPLRPLVGSQHPYWFFYVAVLVTAWYAGLRRALLALALGALSANYFFLPPAYSLAIAGTANQIGLALFLVAALVGMLLIEALRQQQPAAAPAFRVSEPATAAVQEAERRLAAARQGSRALATQLKTVREELAHAREQLLQQREEIDRLTRHPRRRGRGAAPAAAAPLARLPIPGPHSVALLRIAEIDSVECRSHQVFVRTRTGEHPISYTLAELEARLPADVFFRIHDGCLVNLDQVRDLVSLESGCHEIRLADGHRLPVDPARGAALYHRLGLTHDGA